MQIKALSVSEVTQYIKRILINDPILGHIYIKGEISNYKFHSSGHMYFTLKDTNSKIHCVMFKSNCEHLNFIPKEGMSVICKGQISLYEKDGQYQLYVREMEPAGVGALYLAYQQLKEKLEKEGLFDIKHKKEILYIPKKIGIITSPTGAAIRDMISIILRRFPKVEIMIFPVLVQGEAAPTSIVDGINLCNQFEDIDVAIVGRGGGSIEELWAFNEEIVARTIFNSRIPIISAVGHETDFTIADFVADLRAPTPSAAAELAVPNLIDLNEYMESLKKRLVHSIKGKMNRLKQELALVENSYPFKYPLNRVHNEQQYIDELADRLTKTIAANYESKSKYLMHLGDRLNGLSPLSVFSRGYSIAKNRNDEIIKSVDQVVKDEIINIDLIDGKINCQVIESIKEVKTLVQN